MTLAAAPICAALFACAVPSGQPEASPASLEFPDTPVGQSVTEDLAISNVAESGALTLESVGISGPGAAMFGDDFDDGSSIVLQPGESTTLAVEFSPTGPGPQSATLQVNHSGTDALSIPLAGTGTDPGPGAAPLVASPAAVNFQSAAIGQPATSEVVLRNGAPEGALTVEATEITGPDAAMFSDAFDDGTTATLAPGESLTVALAFSPTATGNRSATLRVTHSGTNSPLSIPLSGHGSPSPAQVVLYRVNSGGGPVPGPAGSPAWSADSAASPSPYGNAGSAGNTVTSWTTEVDVSDPSVPAGTPAEIFRTERYDAPAAPDLAYSFPVPSGVPVEVRLYLAELFTPSQVVGGRVFDVEVEGTVVARDVDVFARVGADTGLVLSAPAASDGSVDVRLRAGIGNPAVKAVEVLSAGGEVPPWLAASPSIVTFPSATVRQTATQDVLLTNVGTSGPVSVTSTAVSGPDAVMFADRFDDAAGPVVLQPGESTTVTVAFLPTASGSRSATLSVAHSGAGSPLVIPLSGTAVPPTSAGNPPFGKSLLSGASVAAPTSLQFGPDGRLYVAQMNGLIRALTVARTADNQYAVTATETIPLVRAIPNHDDDGAPNPAVTDRLVTGLLVTGTAARPEIYVVSSDPRIGAGTSGDDLDLDTNSGVLSRLVRVGGAWQRTDLVRGLPRSEENHTGNGLALEDDTDDDTLLIAYGGNTNQGAPSHNFAGLPEFALSGAILAVDLEAIGDSTYDLPTLDDEDRPGSSDSNDPFGGNDGRNQARLVPGGPVQVHAPGFRNPYDLALTESGDLYTIDNGPNAGWGARPQPDDATGACTNEVAEPGTTFGDALIRIPGAGFYGGHPNPTRANPANTFNASNPQTPVAAANPVECDYRTEAERGALASFAFSTNGLDEYTADNFGGAMQGDLLAAAHNDAIHRIRLSPDGTSVVSNTVLFSSAASLPLDVTALGDADPFPGTVWVADFQANAVVVFEPEDFRCTGADDPGLDEDGDGFDNADELDNGTNPCSPADAPPDVDGDGTSDLNDSDDDNDGLPDTTDPFAVDSANGRDTALPVVHTWDNDAPPAGGLLGLGFTGLMTNGSADYADLFDAAQMTAGGAAGVVTVDAASEGDALGAANTQEYAFQHGVDVSPATGPYVVHTRLPAPFAGTAPAGAQSYGMFVGTGTQDDYVKLVVAANDGVGGFALVDEQAGTATAITTPGPAWPSASVVDLYLRVDPATGTVAGSYSIDGAAPVAVGPPRLVPTSWFTGAAGPAVGIISTSAGAAPPFPATWDFLEVLPAPPPSGPSPSSQLTVGAPGLNSSTFTSGSFRLANDSPAGQQIASVRLDLSTSLLPDLVFDPAGAAGDVLGKGFTVDSNPGVGSIGHAFAGAHDGGYDVLTATFSDFGPGETLAFSVDIDPTSIKGGSPPGPGESGSVSGLELTGTRVTVVYEDGSTETGSLFRSPGSLGQAEVRLDGTGRPTPALAVVGVGDAPATVGEPAQTVRITGSSGATVRLLAVESALFTSGLPGGGFDLDPFEANSVVAVAEHTATVGPEGWVDVPVTLTSTVAAGGNNRLVAVVVDGAGTGATSNVVVLQLE